MNTVPDKTTAIVCNVTRHASVIVSDARRHCEDGSPGMSDHARNTGPMLASPRCGARIRSGGSCRSPAVRGKRRCRMHGGAQNSGAPKENRNALTHGLFTGNAIGERKRIQDLLADARKLLTELK